MNTNALFVAATVLAATFVGCKMGAYQTGFLSDYAKLQKDEDDDALRYINNEVKSYKSFIVDPVQCVSHKGADPVDADAAEVVTSAFHKDIVTRLEAANYKVVHSPGPGVARLRVAITDIENSNPVLNIIPQTKLLGVGLGGAAMEAEIVDSQTGKQVGAVVQGQRGSRLSFAGATSRQGDAKAVCGNWAEAFVERLNKVHGR